MPSETTSGDFLERIQKLSPARLALLAAELERRLAAREGTVEPIAIIGLGCHMPGGVETPDALWNLLAKGVDAIEEIPSSRWDANAFYDPRPDTPGKAVTKWGGFVSHIDQFDAAFFGIAPREAVGMDPQHRMLLEVSWEALENACVRADSLNGSSTGVFVGISTNDYSWLQDLQDEQTLDAYTGSGSARSVAAGRLSYFLGLKGPNFAVDTACSSSAVAIHLACQSLRQSECRLALAGGVNAALVPHGAIALSQAHMMASDGRCKAFSKSADGFVRSEGCGILVLKRLTDAKADGDRILGLIRGSAINHDGRSSGLSAPNGPSQEAVVKAALKQAGLTPEDIDYVETHGTGTVLGDAIELGALGSVFDAPRSDGSELIIGSVKTNIGHLEAAAGSAGMIKVLLAMQHECIPPHLHVSDGQENEALEKLHLKLPLHTTSWPVTKRPRIAGISSFGFSGTNAHIIIEEAPQAPLERNETSATEIITISAKSAAALTASCARHAEWLRANPQTSLADLAFSLNAGRSHFQHRVPLLVSSTKEAADQLQQIADGKVESHPSYRFLPGFNPPGVGFLFTGQGSQYEGMGRALYAQSSVFRSAVDRSDKILSGKLAHPLSAVLNGDESIPANLIHDTTWTQPALFAFEYALAMLWRSWGVRPSIVLGHSLGEYVAACIAGVFPLDSALTLAYERGRLMGSLPRSGGMLAIRTGETEVTEIIRSLDRLSIAAVNSAKSVVISGDSDQIEQLRTLLSTRGVVSQPLTVSHAFHSALMDPILEEFEQQAGKLTIAAPAIPFVSNVSGSIHSAQNQIDASYWRKHVRGTVRFADGFASLMTHQPAALLEIGPDPVLLGMAKPALVNSPMPCLPSLRRNKDPLATMYEALRQLYLLGSPIDWDQVYRDRPARKLALPTYPFQRQRYWTAIPARFAVPPVTPPPSSFDPLLYTTEWRIQQEPGAGTQSSDGPPVLFLSEIVPSNLPATLQSAGLLVDDLNPWPSFSSAPEDETQRELLRRRLLESGPSSPIILELAEASAEEDIPARALKSATAVLVLIQDVMEAGASQSAIWLVTRGAFAIDNGSTINVSSTIVDGFAKTVRLEHPALQIHCIDLPSQPSEKDVTRLAQLLREGSNEPTIAIRDGKVFVPRLTRLNAVSSSSGTPMKLISGAAYLVTGAYGGLGFRTVQWMADSGATCIVMAGRRAPTPEIRQQIETLRDRGIEIYDLLADISKRSDAKKIFNCVAEARLVLRGIVHAAGTIDDGTLLQQTPQHLERVFASKVFGGWLLHELSQNSPLDFFVLFGSAASVLGSAGQSNYAAANGFLDGLSHFRQQAGLPSTTIAWGAWSEIGMATRVKDTGRAARMGVSALSPDKGIALLEQAIASNQASVAALPIDWSVYLAPGHAQHGWPFFESLSVVEQRIHPSPERSTTLKTLLGRSSAEQKPNVIREHMRTRIADVLRLDPSFVLRNDQPLAELGLDSLMALELKNELQASLGETLPPNFFFEYPTLDMAATYLSAKLVVARNGMPESNSSEYEELAI